MTPSLEEAETAGLAQDLTAIAQRCAALPVLDAGSAEEILAYDEDGLPS